LKRQRATFPHPTSIANSRGVRARTVGRLDIQGSVNVHRQSRNPRRAAGFDMVRETEAPTRKSGRNTLPHPPADLGRPNGFEAI